MDHQELSTLADQLESYADGLKPVHFGYAMSIRRCADKLREYLQTEGGQ